MDPKEIKELIDELNYDLTTVQYLHDFGRIKETVPIVQKILDRITAFKNKSDLPSLGLNSIFDEQFLVKNLSADVKLDDVRKNIKDFSFKPDLEKHLLEIGYLKFLFIFQSWIYKNISILKGITKSTKQKQIECWSFILAGTTFLLSLTIFFLHKVDEKNWGLRGEFYEGTNFEKFITLGSNKNIDFNEYLAMNSHLPQENFSARWQGYLLVPKNGEYTFFLFVDDGVRLFIDNKPLINEWNDQQSEFSNKIILTKGLHLFRVEYYNHLQAAILELSWAIPEGNKEIIPCRFLRQYRVIK